MLLLLDGGVAWCVPPLSLSPALQAIAREWL
jgi:hypothetical protein